MSPVGLVLVILVILLLIGGVPAYGYHPHLGYGLGGLGGLLLILLIVLLLTGRL